MKALIVTVAVLAGAALAGGAVTLYAGWYDISATDQHLAPTYWLLKTGMRESVEYRAEEIEVPPLEDPALFVRGFTHFQAHCVQCHGAPGVAPQPFAMGMTPAPSSLSYSATEMTPAALFYVISEGIKMTGMPAWKYRLTEEDMWAVVAFLERLPRLSPSQYRALEPLEHKDREPPVTRPEGDAQLGVRAIHQYMCVTCHRIPGVVGANAPVGPPLEGIGSRTFIAGLLPNTPENMVRWLRNPQEIDADTAMPDMGVTERDARDIAAYLYTLR